MSRQELALRKSNKRKRPENEIQIAIIEYLRAVVPDCLVFAVPNASRRSPGGRAYNGVPGLTPGIPDLCLVQPGGLVHFIEVKGPRGSLNDSQRAMQEIMRDMKVPHAVVRSINEMTIALDDWGIETREARS